MFNLYLKQFDKKKMMTKVMKLEMSTLQEVLENSGENEHLEELLCVFWKNYCVHFVCGATNSSSSRFYIFNFDQLYQ